MLKKFLYATVIICFILSTNCQAEETPTNEPVIAVEESGGFFSSAKNFFGNLFSSNEEDTDENNDSFFSSAKSFFGGLFSEENEESADESTNGGFFGSAKSFFSGLFSSDDKKESPSEIKRANIEDFDDVSEDNLAEAVVTYVNANPDKREALIDYTFNLQFIRLIQEHKILGNNAREGQLYLNSIPLVGGILNDKMDDNFKEEYKKLLIYATTDNSLFMNAAKRYLENLTEHDYKIFVERNSPSEPETELYNAMMRIAAIRYRELEALIEENKVRVSLDISPIDFIEELSYEWFSSEDNLNTIKRSEQAFEKIYTALWIDSEKMKINGESFLKDYYAAIAKEKVPQQLFPYNLESSWRPSPNEKIRTMKNDESVKRARKRIYDMIAGEWTDLSDGSSCTINIFPSENDNKPQEPPFEYPRMGSISFLDEEQPFVSFYYKFNQKPSMNFFITPATYIDDEGNREDVLVLYKGYELVNNDYKNTLENHRVENIKKAERVLIKKLK